LSTNTSRACAAIALGMLVAAPGAFADTSTGGSAYSANARPRPHQVQRLGDRVPVRQGMRGRDVRDLQSRLRHLGLSVSVDGSFGRQTWSAVRRFEQRARLRVNGVVEPRDIAVLRRAASRGGFPPPPQPPELPPGSKATVDKDGLAAAPADAPQAVKDIIAAGNRIASKPYRYGGGHGNWNDSGYDCSGSISYALHFAGLLQVSRDSTGFESYGKTGYGRWVTIYANGGHAWMMVAGLRFDTSGLSSAGSRWQSERRSVSGYVIRHPDGL
jgi:peptidoglycan hydrolase-like protein with peptidoglycan-binding domain